MNTNEFFFDLKSLDFKNEKENKFKVLKYDLNGELVKIYFKFDYY